MNVSTWSVRSCHCPPFSMNTEAVDDDGLVRASHEGSRIKIELPHHKEAGFEPRKNGCSAEG